MLLSIISFSRSFFAAGGVMRWRHTRLEVACQLLALFRQYEEA